MVASSNKPVIRIGAGKGKLLNIIDKFLARLGLEPIEENRKLIHYRETDNYILEICLLRWEDIKTYANEFDMIIYGCDQWLESGKKAMIALDYFEQKNCRLSLLVPEDKKDFPLSYFKEHKIATGYPELAKNYIGIDEKNLVLMTGSVESSIGMGWAESIFDIVESGATAKENGLVEYKIFVKFGAILATTKPEKIPVFADLGLIPAPVGKRVIAFDGIDGSGKSSLAKHLVQEGFGKGEPNVLVCPYSGYIGTVAKSLLDNGKVRDWAITIGMNHWKAPARVNEIYDRNILTFMTELIKINCSETEMLDIISYWPKPNILFYCNLSFEEVLRRTNSRTATDEYDDETSLKEYYELYKKAYEFIKEKTDINIIEINTETDMETTLNEIRRNL